MFTTEYQDFPDFRDYRDPRDHRNHHRDFKPRKSVIRMDPDCAICHQPATLQCDCEAQGLQRAVRQAESRMMESIYAEIRSWVRSHAQDYILEYFRILTERRKAAHTQQLERLSTHWYHYYHQPPHPNEIAAAQATLKRGIDEDWQSSVQRYPEVLEYFFSLVDLNLPQDSDPAVRDPPLSALGGQRKVGRRGSATVASSVAHDLPPPRRATPPAVMMAPSGGGGGGGDRRTPGPRMKPHAGWRPPPQGPPPGAYYPPPGPGGY